MTKRTELHEVYGGAAVAETAKPKPKAAKESKGKGGKKVKETKTKTSAVPAEVDLTQLEPGEFRARAVEALWPASSAWVPRAPLSLGEYLEGR